MNDAQAGVAVIAAMGLAVAIRDDGPQYVARAARTLLDACGGDAIAALSVSAALIRTDLPVDAWWLGLDAEAVPDWTNIWCDDTLDEVAISRYMTGTLQHPPQCAWPPELLEAVRRLVALGFTDRQIAAKVGMTRDAVQKLRNRNGIRREHAA